VIADGDSLYSLRWQNGAEPIDSETCIRLLAPALHQSRSLHTFYFDGCVPEDLHLSVQQNHSIILCGGSGDASDFSDSLLFNRVS
jgi:hypothetical protein